MRQKGYTLTELLIVIAILSLLAALIFSAFFTARGKGREATCVSNLGQIGKAVLMYAQDYDDLLPFGGSPLDLNVPEMWPPLPLFDPIKTIRPLPEVLHPYLKDYAVWKCPADTGFERGGYDESIVFDTRPSSFERYGSSYDLRTVLIFKKSTLTNLQAYQITPPYDPVGQSQIIYLFDGTGLWHGSSVPLRLRRVSLFLDGHVKTLDQKTFLDLYQIDVI